MSRQGEGMYGYKEEDRVIEKIQPTMRQTPSLVPVSKKGNIQFWVRSAVWATLLAGCAPELPQKATTPTPRPTWSWTPEHGTATRPSPTPTATPTPAPTPKPTAAPRPTPTVEPTPEPTLEATLGPTPEPTVEATSTPEPTAIPSIASYPSIYEFADSLSDAEWAQIGPKHIGERHQLIRALEAASLSTNLGPRIFLNPVVLEEDIPIYMDIQKDNSFPEPALLEQWFQEGLAWLRAETGLPLRLATNEGEAKMKMRVSPEGGPDMEEIMGRVYMDNYSTNGNVLYVARSGRLENGVHGVLSIANIMNFGSCTGSVPAKGYGGRTQMISTFVHEILHWAHLKGHYNGKILYARDPERPDVLMGSLMLQHGWREIKTTPSGQCTDIVFHSGHLVEGWREIAVDVLKFKLAYVNKFHTPEVVETLEEEMVGEAEQENHGICDHNGIQQRIKKRWWPWNQR